MSYPILLGTPPADEVWQAKLLISPPLLPCEILMVMLTYTHTSAFGMENIGDSSTGEVTDVGLRREEAVVCLPLSSLSTPSTSPLGTWTFSNSDLLIYFLPYRTSRETLTDGVFNTPSNNCHKLIHHQCTPNISPLVCFR